MNFKKNVKDFVNLAKLAIEAEEKSKKGEITNEEFDIIREFYAKTTCVLISLGVIVTIILIVIAFACRVTLPLKIWLTLFVISWIPKRSEYKIKRSEEKEEDKGDRYKIIDIRDSWK